MNKVIAVISPMKSHVFLSWSGIFHFHTLYKKHYISPTHKLVARNQFFFRFALKRLYVNYINYIPVKKKNVKADKLLLVQAPINNNCPCLTKISFPCPAISNTRQIAVHNHFWLSYTPFRQFPLFLKQF